MMYLVKNQTHPICSVWFWVTLSQQGKSNNQECNKNKNIADLLFINIAFRQKQMSDEAERAAKDGKNWSPNTPT